MQRYGGTIYVARKKLVLKLRNFCLSAREPVSRGAHVGDGQACSTGTDKASRSRIVGTR